mgnify:CR=1 FL=1
MSEISENDKFSMKKLHIFDNFLGYRYGQFLWLTFWIPSLATLACYQTPGHDRNFLFQATLMSSITLLYYSYHQDRGNPASTPAMHALFGELLARWILFAYHGPYVVINSSPIGIMNSFQIICMGIFTLFKFPASIYTVWNHNTYVDMVREMKDQDRIY